MVLIILTYSPFYVTNVSRIVRYHFQWHIYLPSVTFHSILSFFLGNLCWLEWSGRKRLCHPKHVRGLWLCKFLSCPFQILIFSYTWNFYFLQNNCIMLRTDQFSFVVFVGVFESLAFSECLIQECENHRLMLWQWIRVDSDWQD